MTQIIEADGETGRKGKGSLKREVRAICAELPTFQRFAKMIGCSSALLFYWESRYPEWSEACARARDIQEHWIFQTGLSDRVQSSAFEFVAGNATRHRLRRQQSLEVLTPEPIETRPDLAAMPAAQLELTRWLAGALARGLSPERIAVLETWRADDESLAVNGPAGLGSGEEAASKAEEPAESGREDAQVERDASEEPEGWRSMVTRS